MIHHEFSSPPHLLLALSPNISKHCLAGVSRLQPGQVPVFPHLHSLTMPRKLATPISPIPLSGLTPSPPILPRPFSFTEDSLHSPANKIKWREFCMRYDGVLEDYNFGTLLRLSVDAEYSPENSTFAPRVQFLAIEIARNRAGLNKIHFKK